MKQLQSNFTTPEQSKRLLELGVPEWTADLRYRICKANDSIIGNPYITKGKKYIGSHFNYSLPCWSVGRLIEILEIVVDALWSDYKVLDKSTLIERVLKDFEKLVKHKKMDFSKLEE